MDTQKQSRPIFEHSIISKLLLTKILTTYHQIKSIKGYFMKSFIALAVLVFSASSFAESKIEDSIILKKCGGTVELRRYVNEGEEKFALLFYGVRNCSNVILSSGKSHKLTDRNGKFLDKNISLSDEAVLAAKKGGLALNLESNSGEHIEEYVISIRHSVPVSGSNPNSTSETDFAPTDW